MINSEESEQENCFHSTTNTALTMEMIESHTESTTHGDDKPKLLQIDASSNQLPKHPVYNLLLKIYVCVLNQLFIK